MSAPLRVRPAPRTSPPPVARIAPILAPAPDPSAPRYVQDFLDSNGDVDAVDFGYRPTPASDLPDPVAWAARLAQALVEVMLGTRPASQLLRWTSTEVYDVVARRAHVAVRRRHAARVRGQAALDGRVRVRRVLTCLPAADTVEATVVIEERDRIRAVALRLSGLDGRWVVTALQTG